jgi:hypothetical protein
VACRSWISSTHRRREIEGVLDASPSLGAVVQIGHQVDLAVRAAVPHVRAVRWRPARVGLSSM